MTKRLLKRWEEILQNCHTIYFNLKMYPFSRDNNLNRQNAENASGGAAIWVNATEINHPYKEYDKIIRKAFWGNLVQENPSSRRGCPKCRNILFLIDRLRDITESVCQFMKHFAVPFDHNQAE